jgi:hypothetical protein
MQQCFLIGNSSTRLKGGIKGQLGVLSERDGSSTRVSNNILGVGRLHKILAKYSRSKFGPL